MKNKITPILGMSFVYIFFVTSTFNYQHVYWFHYLIISRIVVGVVGVMLALFICFSKTKFKHWGTIFLTFILLIQASHGILEPYDEIGFFQFCGIVYLVAALSYDGSFRFWLCAFAPIQLLAIAIPMIIKQLHVGFSIPAFVDIFSLPIASAGIGTILTFIMSTKHETLKKNLELQTTLAKESEYRSTALYNLSSQVSHDIRSPLAALNAVTKNLPEVDEEKRLLIRSAVQRIDDIANDLSSKKVGGADKEVSGVQESQNLETHLLSSLVEP